MISPDVRRFPDRCVALGLIGTGTFAESPVHRIANRTRSGGGHAPVHTIIALNDGT